MTEAVATEETPKKRRRATKKKETIDTPIPANPAPAAKAKAKGPDTWTEAFPVVLTPEELATNAALMTQTALEIEELEAEKKVRTADIKGKIDGKKARFRELVRIQKSGQEEREVELFEEFVFAQNSVNIRRVDTNEVVRSRAMYASERQEALPLETNAQGDTPLPAWATSKEEYKGRDVESEGDVSQTEPPPAPEDGTEIDNPEGVLSGDLDAEEFASGEDEGL